MLAPGAQMVCRQNVDGMGVGWELRWFTLGQGERAATLGKQVSVWLLKKAFHLGNFREHARACTTEPQKCKVTWPGRGKARKDQSWSLVPEAGCTAVMDASRHSHPGGTCTLPLWPPPQLGAPG